MPILSVLDPRRSENLHRESCSGSYTFSPTPRRIPKVEFSLGWELEANNGASRVPAGVSVISDGSVNGDSIEYVSLPSVVRSPRFALGLLKQLVHAPNLNTDKSCGFHIHLSPRGVTQVKARQWALACEALALRIEEQAFDAVPDSRKGNTYCKGITPLRSGEKFSANKYSNPRRYHWLNTVEMFRPGGIRTVEVRLLGNTHRWKYLTSWSLFCLSLAREAWNVSHDPSSLNHSVDVLQSILKGIAEEVKPLARKSEPIPSWVYDGLKRNGIDFTKWERPLAKIADTESEIVRGYKVWYSDNQPTVENDSDDEQDEDNLCPCGCGDEGRCTRQIHDDGDCCRWDCEACHENGDCATERCISCREDAHGDNRLCTWSTCSACMITRRLRETAATEAMSLDECALSLERYQNNGGAC